MRVAIFNTAGLPAGSREIPDDVIAAANKVRAFLMLLGKPGALCGVTLADAPATTPVTRVRCLACPRCPDCPERNA